MSHYAQIRLVVRHQNKVYHRGIATIKRSWPQMDVSALHPAGSSLKMSMKKQNQLDIISFIITVSFKVIYCTLHTVNNLIERCNL